MFIHHFVSCYQAGWIESAEFALLNSRCSLRNLFPHVALLCLHLLVVNNRLTSQNVANICNLEREKTPIWDTASIFSLFVVCCVLWLHLSQQCFWLDAPHPDASNLNNRCTLIASVWNVSRSVVFFFPAMTLSKTGAENERTLPLWNMRNADND